MRLLPFVMDNQVDAVSGGKQCPLLGSDMNSSI